MKSWVSAAVLILVGVLAFLTLGQAQTLPPEVENALHPITVLRLESQEETKSIWNLRENPDLAGIIVLDVERRYLSTPQIEILKNWVFSGHSLRLVSKEGRESLLEAFGFSSQRMSHGTFRCLTTAASTHPVLTDVAQVKLTTRYPAHELLAVTGGFETPLLSCGGKPVAVLSSWGSGYILVCPGIRTEEYDGMRFWVNAKEFLSGYPVPGSVMVGGLYPSSPTGQFDTITFRNGDVRSGTVMTNSFAVDTRYGGFTIQTQEIARIEFGENVDVIYLWMGDRISGSIQNRTIAVELAVGGNVTFEVREVKSIVFRQQ